MSPHVLGNEHVVHHLFYVSFSLTLIPPFVLVFPSEENHYGENATRRPSKVVTTVPTTETNRGYSDSTHFTVTPGHETIYGSISLHLRCNVDPSHDEG